MSLLARRLSVHQASGGGGGGFSPDDVTGLVVWLDADALTGYSNGDTISTVDNLAETETYTASSTELKYNTNIQNSKPGMRVAFGVHLDGTVSRTLKPATYFAVVNIENLTTGTFTVIGNVGGTNPLQMRAYQKKINLVQEGTASIGSSSTDLVTDTTYLLDASYDASGNYLFGLDGTDDGSGTNDKTIGADEVCIGARESSSELFQQGYIFEILIYDNEVSSSDRTDIRDYLTTKWGL